MTKKSTLITALSKKAGFALFCGALFFSAGLSAQTTRYVKPLPAGTADGSSWDNASSDIQSVLNSSTNGDAVWVAGGTYKPIRKANDLNVITPNDRDNAFVLKDSVQLYGGFAGTELLLSERNLAIAENASILSGDFNDDDELEYSGDTLSIKNNAENAYHVLIGVGVGGAVTDTLDRYTRVDGFIIKGGNANDTLFGSITVNALAIYRYTGGGLMNRIYSKPTLVNVTFTGNNAIYGGGVYNRSYSNIILQDAVITQNTASFGGGITNWLNTSATLTNVLISQNTAQAGGGIYNYNNCNPTLNNVNILDNYASIGSGGGMFNNTASPILNTVSILQNMSGINGGGIFNTSTSLPVLNDVTINSNSAQNGGGIYNTGGSNMIVNNSVISSNTATAGNGGGIFNNLSVPVFNNVEISGNTATQFGGGVCNFTMAPAQFNTATISGNNANNGAGVFNYDGSPAVFTNVTFEGNEATGNGGGAYNRLASAAVFTNCLFTANSGQYGGGIYNLDNASPILTNVTIAGNSASNLGGGLVNDGTASIVRNSIIYGNTITSGDSPNVFNYNEGNPVFSYSLIEGTTGYWENFGTDGGGNIDEEPLFTNAENGDYTLTAESPAVNHGSNTYYAEGGTPDLSLITTDLAGNPRFYDGTPIDMGAYELQEFVGLDNFSQLQVTCYPNPVVNYLTISAKDDVTGVSVYNMLGQAVANATWNPANNTINMASLQTGSYIVKVTIGSASKSVVIIKK